jgi:hypothetical protein
MVLHAVWQSISNWPLAQFIAGSSWAFPTVETFHVVAIVIVLGSIAVMDLRLLGLASTTSRVTEISNDTLPWTWGAFVVAVISGLLLFISKAPDYMASPYFIWKMVLIALAGVNMGVFHVFTWRGVGAWDSNAAVPGAGKLAGALSLALWITVVFLARAIGFTLDLFSAT